MSGVTIVDLSQPATSQSRPAHGETTPFVIAQPKAPSAQLPPQDSVFFDQISQGRLLPLIQPADQRDKQHPQGRNVDHGGSPFRRPRFSLPRPLG